MQELSVTTSLLNETACIPMAMDFCTATCDNQAIVIEGSDFVHSKVKLDLRH